MTGGAIRGRFFYAITLSYILLADFIYLFFSLPLSAHFAANRLINVI